MRTFERRRALRGLVTAVLLAASASSAAAQTANPLGGIDDGDRVWVTSINGVETEGTVVGVPSATTVDLTVGSTRRSIRIDDIQRIEGRDSVKNGAIIGAVIGGAAMALVAAWAIELGDEGQGVSSRDIFAAIRLSALAAGGGALAGAGIDRAIDGRRTLYAAPGARAGITVRPIFSPASSGVRLTVQW